MNNDSDLPMAPKPSGKAKADSYIVDRQFTRYDNTYDPSIIKVEDYNQPTKTVWYDDDEDSM